MFSLYSSLPCLLLSLSTMLTMLGLKALRDDVCCDEGVMNGCRKSKYLNDYFANQSNSIILSLIC